METILLVINGVLSFIVIFLILFYRKNASANLPLLQNKIGELQLSLTTIDSGLKQDFRINREENATIAKDNRSELNNTLKDFKAELSETLKNITEQNQNALKEINITLANKVDLLITKIDDNNKANRETLANNLNIILPKFQTTS